MTNDRNAKTIKFDSYQVDWIIKMKAGNATAEKQEDKFFLSQLIRTLLAKHILAVEVEESDKSR